MRRLPLRLGVYVVTAAGLAPGRGHLEVALGALAGGADVIQVRAPELAGDDLLDLAARVTAAVQGSAALAVVNDDVEVALAVGADGVHLGQADLRSRGATVADLRGGLARDLLLGVSVDDVPTAIEAERGGADYLGVTVWGTATKGDARPLGTEGLRRIAAAVSLPVVAIGGVTLERAPEALAAGAAGIAVVSAVAAAPDPIAATRALRAVVDAHLPR